MGKRLVPLTMVSAMFAFATSAGLLGLVSWRADFWSPSIRLVVAAGVVPMIFAVSIRVVPVFARRDWRSERLLRLQILCSIAGGWLLFAGSIRREADVQRVAHLLLASSSFLFITNLFLLFRRPPLPNRPAPPLPYPEHRSIDRIARGFTMVSALYLIAGLSIGAVTSLWPPTTGRWELVWAHAMLVGFFLSMASGTSYHVLARWTGKQWKWPKLIPIHLVTTLICLPTMLIALATGRTGLFSVAGPLQAIAVLLFLANVVPMAWNMPTPSRAPLMLAITSLSIGVALGAFFAGHPVVGVHYRNVHAELNIFGWTGLLITGMAYYLVPRLFGHPLKLPRLATIQSGTLAIGVTLNALASSWQIERGGGASAVLFAHGMISISFLLLGSVIALTMLSAKPGRTISAIQIQPRPNKRSLPTQPASSSSTT